MSWQYSTVYDNACGMIEEQALAGQTVCRVWLLNRETVVPLPRSAVRPLTAELSPKIEAVRSPYVAAHRQDCRAAGSVALAHGVQRLVSGHLGLPRFGKTIEVRLATRELKLIGLVQSAREIGLEVRPRLMSRITEGRAQ